MSESEELFLLMFLTEDCLALYQEGKLHPWDALVVAKLSGDLQLAYATKCMSADQFKMPQNTVKERRYIDGHNVDRGHISYSMR